MADFECPAFPCLPDRNELQQSLAFELRQFEVQDPVSIELFPFASCTPAFLVVLKDRKKIVLRSAQVNDIEMTPPESHSLKKEIYALKKLGNAGVPVAGLLFDGRIFQCVASGQSWQYFAMEYAEGLAFDRRFEMLNHGGRKDLLAKCARIYATAHKTKNGQFGFMDCNGHETGVFSESFYKFINGLFDFRLDLVGQHVDLEKSIDLRIFANREIQDIAELMEAHRYAPQPSLTLYDGSSGNLLVEQSGRVSVIDVALSGWFDPLMEFPPVLFSLKRFISKGEDLHLWKFFLQEYRLAGAVLPPDVLFNKLLRLYLVNLMIHNAVYCATHHDPARHGKAGPHLALAIKLAMLDETSIEAILGALG